MNSLAPEKRCKLTGKRQFNTANGASNAARVFGRRHGKEYGLYTCWFCRRIHLFTKAKE